MKQLILFSLASVIALSSCKQKVKETVRSDFMKYYDQYHVDGSFALLDQNNYSWVFYHKEQFKRPFIPASTFKICNSLIGLETGVIRDENFVIPWDGKIHQNQAWNQDQDLKSAFKNSTVWYYQELARRVGGQQMKFWLEKAAYGNADTAGGIDKFWLTGNLRITPEQQIGFLKRLYENKLPFSQRSMDIVKRIMIAKDTLNYVVRVKTGWGKQQGKNIGWYVGYVEKAGNVYYFANCIQTADSNNTEFPAARIKIVYQILTDLKIIAK